MRKRTIVMRKEATARGLKRYYTGKPCSYGHLAPRDTGSCACVRCSWEEMDGSDWSRKDFRAVRQSFMDNMTESIPPFHTEHIANL